MAGEYSMSTDEVLVESYYWQENSEGVGENHDPAPLFYFKQNSECLNNCQ